MSTNTSIGPDANRGGNDNPGNADGCGNKTLGEQATQQPPTGAQSVVGEAGAQAGPEELEAARGRLTRDR